jgi:DNA-binding NarL/FixJ family response regulator
MKVMIVDDSAQVRRMITSFLGDLVEEFVECSDGSEAPAAYRTHRPDLVLMDFQMKNTNGFEATRQIKKEFPEARVVIVSQWDSEALREAAAEAGVDAYVNKKSLVPLRDFIRCGPQVFFGDRREEN